MNTSFPRWLRGAAAAVVLPALAACSTGVGNPPATSPSPAPDVYQLYAMALDDAAIYEAREVVPLKGIHADADGTVLVATLKAGAWPQQDTTLANEVWVSVSPEVRDSCDDWPEADQPMRLRQLLGLQPTQPVAYFMEMRVPVAGLFRPTANPAIDTDILCDTTAAPGCALSFPADADPAHVRWMVNQAFSSWKMPNGYPGENTGVWQQLGYPWTRLGYTYNWHPGSPRYGASEYVIRPGTRVTVTRVASIAEYCRRS